MNLTIDTYIPGATLVHACDARCKIVLLLAYSIAIFFVDTWPGMLGMALLACGISAVAHLGAQRMCKLLAPVFVLAAFTVLFNAIPFSTEGLLRGLFFGCRMVLLVAMSFNVCLTTTSNALVTGFASLIAPLRALRVPVDDIATTLALSVRFIPVAAEELGLVHAAQASRGAAFSTGSVIARSRAYAGLFVPLFAGMFRRADALATSMDARCYGFGRPTRLAHERSVGPSIAALVAGLVILVALAVFL